MLGDKNEIEFKLEHCNCTRKIPPGKQKIVVDRNGNEKIKGNQICRGKMKNEYQL